MCSNFTKMLTTLCKYALKYVVLLYLLLGDQYFHITDVNTQVEFKSHQWFGATVRSHGNSILVRMVWFWRRLTLLCYHMLLRTDSLFIYSCLIAHYKKQTLCCWYRLSFSVSWGWLMSPTDQERLISLIHFELAFFLWQSNSLSPLGAKNNPAKESSVYGSIHDIRISCYVSRVKKHLQAKSVEDMQVKGFFSTDAVTLPQILAQFRDKGYEMITNWWVWHIMSLHDVMSEMASDVSPQKKHSSSTE